MAEVPLPLFLVSFQLHRADRERVQRAFSFGKAPCLLLTLLDFVTALGLAARTDGDISQTDRASRERGLILRTESEKHFMNVFFSGCIFSTFSFRVVKKHCSMCPCLRGAIFFRQHTIRHLLILILMTKLILRVN